MRTDACLLISFYFETADLLTAGARLQTIRNAVAHGHTWKQWKDYSSEGLFLTVRFADLWQKVDRRLRTLMAAEKMLVEDPEILGGTPVIRGTLVPVHIESKRNILQRRGWQGDANELPNLCFVWLENLRHIKTLIP